MASQHRPVKTIVNDLVKARLEAEQDTAYDLNKDKHMNKINDLFDELEEANKKD